MAFRLALRDARLSLGQSLVWVKQAFVLSRQDYHWQHETLLYGWKDGARHAFFGGRTESIVWKVNRPLRSDEHPIMKPVALVVRAPQQHPDRSRCLRRLCRVGNDPARLRNDRTGRAADGG